jgi:hypothetical protein
MKAYFPVFLDSNKHLNVFQMIQASEMFQNVHVRMILEPSLSLSTVVFHFSPTVAYVIQPTVFVASGSCRGIVTTNTCRTITG